MAEPPPRRVGSATAWTNPCRPNSSAVSAPISGTSAKTCPLAASAFPAVRRGTPAPPATTCCATRPGRGHCLRQGHAEFDAVEHGLQDRRDDRRSARAAERQQGFAVVQHDGRCHRRARPLAGGGQVGVGGVALGGCEVEVGELVVEQEAALRHDDAAAAGRLDGECVRDNVAPPVRHREVGGREPFRAAAGRAGRLVTAARVVAVGDAGSDGLRQDTGAVDQAGSFGRRSPGTATAPSGTSTWSESPT